MLEESFFTILRHVKEKEFIGYLEFMTINEVIQLLQYFFENSHPSDLDPIIYLIAPVTIHVQLQADGSKKPVRLRPNDRFNEVFDRDLAILFSHLIIFFLLRWRRNRDAGWGGTRITEDFARASEVRSIVEQYVLSYDLKDIEEV